ncbi:Uncharacterised protein [uncultured archaeon]|nr:Uncharacterised protein [uncultured archaeon]
MELNKAFFGLYENWFIITNEELGEDKAIDLFTKVMRFGLKKAYDAYDVKPGPAKEFARVVKERDNSVGLRVEFPEVTDKKIVYRFIDDPFPGLKGKVNHSKLDRTYMQFKVDYILGKDWSYKTTKHIWKGDPYIEHIITKK